ncbi:hypothetical protein BJY00DRAFT_308797 [Aspergillus carlsbadensis]|nr:hypothetical protein BJY00DRAFT_308797 [Aspergillus carlsbadensis]
MEGYGTLQMDFTAAMTAKNTGQGVIHTSPILTQLQNNGGLSAFNAASTEDMPSIPGHGDDFNVPDFGSLHPPYPSTGFPPLFPNPWPSHSHNNISGNSALSQSIQTLFNTQHEPFVATRQNCTHNPQSFGRLSTRGPLQPDDQAAHLERSTSAYPGHSYGSELGTDQESAEGDNGSRFDEFLNPDQSLYAESDRLNLYLFENAPTSSVSDDSGYGRSPSGSLYGKNDSLSGGHIDHRFQPENDYTSPEAMALANGYSYPQLNHGLPHSDGGQAVNFGFELPIPNSGQNGSGEQSLVNGQSEGIFHHRLQVGNGQPGFGEIERLSFKENERENGDQGKNNNEDDDDAFDDTADDDVAEAGDQPLASDQSEATALEEEQPLAGHSEATALAEATQREVEAHEEVIETSVSHSGPAKELSKSGYEAEKKKTRESLGQMLAAVDEQSPRPTKFTTLEEALRETLTRDASYLPDSANDTTLPRTDAQKQAYVVELVKAMKSMEFSRDNKTEADRYRTNLVRKDNLIELRGWQILEDSIDLHTLGRLTCFTAVVVTKKGEYSTFADRMTDILWTLKSRKSCCKTLLDPPRRQKLVHDPLKQVDSIKSNLRTNGGKGDDIREGREAKKAKKSQEQPNSVAALLGHSQGTRGDASTKGTRGTRARKPRSSRGRSKAKNNPTSNRVSSQTSGISELGDGHSPAKNSNKLLSAKLPQQPAWEQVNTPQNSHSLSDRNSTYSSTNLDADAHHAQTSTSEPRPNNGVGPNRKEPTSTQLSQTSGTRVYRFAENRTPEGQQQFQQGRAGQFQKRALEETDERPATTKKRRV